MNSQGHRVAHALMRAVSTLVSIPGQAEQGVETSLMSACATSKLAGAMHEC